jgi:hypothetical protein
MKRGATLLPGLPPGLLPGLLLGAALTAGLAGPATAVRYDDPAGSRTTTANVAVELDRTDLATGIGQRFTFTSTVRNNGDDALDGLVAHLNVLGLEPSVYVDPEDWSSERTQFLDELPAHGSEELSWEVQAVSPGALAIYVTVTAKQGSADVTASSALRVSVTQARKLNAADAAPLVLGMPAAVVLLIGLTAFRRRGLR